MSRSRVPHDLHVVSTETITPHLVRIWFGGDGFAAIAARDHTDAYVKLVFAQPGDAGPVRRTYTIQQVDDETAGSPSISSYMATRGSPDHGRRQRNEVPLPLPAGFEVHWVRRVGEDHSQLVDAVLSAPWPTGVVQVFAHGEAEVTMRRLRPYLRKARGVPASLASISGYWRHGRTEEAFRSWKRELAEEDAAAPAV